MERVKRLSYEVLSALQYLHTERITHRNLTLKNVQLDSQVPVYLYLLYYYVFINNDQYNK